MPSVLRTIRTLLAPSNQDLSPGGRRMVADRLTTLAEDVRRELAGLRAHVVVLRLGRRDEDNLLRRISHLEELVS